ncbi:STP1 protein, partial [Plasmodium ovale curtisi]
MKKFIHTCNEIEKASKKSTINIFIRYKTPILDGAIKIINEFLKDKNDGVHYKKLCDELPKYIRVQKKCFKQEIEKQGKNLTTREWNIILNALLTTFTYRNINRLYFCIEKKRLYENTNNMDFEQCNEYMSWLSRKKMELQVLDPNYEYIKEYQEYFDIRDNCNYPWLLKDTGGITCQRLTRTKAGEKDNEPKTLNTSIQSAPAVTTVSSTEENKDTSSKSKSPSNAELDPSTSQSPNTDKGKVSAKDTISGGGDFNPQNSISNVMVQGAPIQQPIPIFKYTPASKIPKLKSIFETLSTNLDGNKITDVVRHLFSRKPITNANKYPNDVKGYPIKHNITHSYNFIPPKILHSKPFIQVLLSKKIPSSNNRLQSLKEPFPPPQPLLPTIVNSQPYLTKIPSTVKRARKTKPIKIQDAFFSNLSPFPEITSGTQQNEIVFIEPALPDASYFRSPFMIYTLVLLGIFTIISTFYLFSKYTPLGLLFSKKKKKKRLKRHLEIKKIPEESLIFDKITNYSVNDMPYENKTHNDNNMYSKIKIQKGLLNKNISLPKKKKNKRKAIIDIHMELFNEYKNDEWELNKNDFLQICLEEFIREQNKIYSNSENSNSMMKNISIQNTKEDKMLILDKWTESCRPIWEKFKSENAFKVLQYEWKKEEKEYLENIEQFENNFLNENTEISYKEIKKEIWRKWIKKQAKIIEQFTQEKWFKSLV